jgi:uroporphyrinogen-III synthase
MKTILYLGLEPSESFLKKNRVLHCPVIKIIPKNASCPDIQKAFKEILLFTHLLFTSKNSVRIFFEMLAHFGMHLEMLSGNTIIAVGK